jgi:hypothetical protein
MRTLAPILALTLLACASQACTASDATLGASEDDVTSAGPAQVTRTETGAFRFESAIPARVADCEGAAGGAKGACEDADADGLVDAWEDAVVAKLAPVVTFDEDEPMMDEGNRDAFGEIARVFPVGDRVVVSFLLLYTRDFGAKNRLCFGAKAHAGDAERAALELELVGSAGHRGDARTTAAYSTGHEGTPDEQTTILRGGEQSQLEDVDGRWRVYSSQSKHATYLTKRHCEGARLSTWLHRFCASEDCAPDRVDDVGKYTRVPAVLNVGEEDAPRADDLGPVGFPGLRIWGDDRFCGGVTGLSDEETAKCPDPLRTKLPKNPFEG